MNDDQAATDSGAEPETPATQSEQDAGLLAAYLDEQSMLEQDDESGELPAAQDESDEKQAADLFTVKINGEEKQVTHDELIAHYQKGEASNKKFEEAAALRREAEAKKAEYVQHQQLMQNAINYFVERAQQFPQQAEPNWTELLENNPHEYLKQKKAYEERAADYHKALTAQAYLQQQNLEAERNYIQAEERKLPEVIPEWKNEKVREEEIKQIINYLTVDKGWSEDRIKMLDKSSAIDISIVLQSMKYEQAMKQARSASKKVQSLPPRMERTGVSTTNTEEKTRAIQRLSRTGSIDDAASAFAALFGQ